ncbi:rano class II histocompatibility antigen, A beta chain-like [Osmerus mordax]|uniref:rano class II histocompatibility antigen, A beta chain-like n=1 Tax=Osmerus mordax TaxID=8014 RepID=UPI003510AFD6
MLTKMDSFTDKAYSLLHQLNLRGGNMSNLSSKRLLLLFIFLSLFGHARSSNGYFSLTNARCQIPSRDAKDMEYILEYHFNGKLLLMYNSTQKKYTGYTPKAVLVAAKWTGTYDILMRESDKDLLCKSNAAAVWDTIRMNTAEPDVQLWSVKPFSSGHPNMLVCSAYDFYPKQIKVTWLKDGQHWTSDVTSTEELSNLDWTYQLHTYLEYVPKPGERITCMVEHASLARPKLYDWDPLPESETNKIIVGICGQLLGIVCVAAGLIKYKLKSTAGRVLVPAS